MAYHSCAVFEAEHRGLMEVLQVQFPQEAAEFGRPSSTAT